MFRSQHSIGRLQAEGQFRAKLTLKHPTEHDITTILDDLQETRHAIFMHFSVSTMRISLLFTGTADFVPVMLRLKVDGRKGVGRRMEWDRAKQSCSWYAPSPFSCRGRLISPIDGCWTACDRQSHPSHACLYKLHTRTCSICFSDRTPRLRAESWTRVRGRRERHSLASSMAGVCVCSVVCVCVCVCVCEV